MKKNKTLRAAGILFLATMLTTCMTAGTFAKYTTGTSANDSARVAKFGVLVSADGNLYGEEYASASDADNPNGIIAYSGDTNTGTVQVSATGTKVVAPGTKNETGLGFGITGKPEVDVKVEAKINKANDVFLKAGTYGVLVENKNVTVTNYDKTKLYVSDNGTYKNPTSDFDSTQTYYSLTNSTTVATDYYPIKYSLVNTTTGTTEDAYKDKKLSEIADVIDEIDGTYQANTDLSTALKSGTTTNLDLSSSAITWEWKFEDNNDSADTILGDLAAANSNGKIVKLSGTDYVPVENTDYSINTAFDMSITVTQID